MPTMQQAASRTHALTHARTHCSNQVAESLSTYVDDQYHITQVLLLLKTASSILDCSVKCLSPQFCRLATEPTETLDFALDIDDFFS